MYSISFGLHVVTSYINLVSDSDRHLLRSAAHRMCVLPCTQNALATEALLLWVSMCGTVCHCTCGRM